MKNSLPKILITTPVYNGKHHSLHDWMQCVFSLTYPNYEVFIVDNSFDATYVDKVKELYYSEETKFTIEHIDCTNKNSKQKIADSYQRIQQYFLAGEYEYLFVLEQDIRIPANGIEHLLFYQYPVLSIPYFTGQGTGSFLLIWYLSFNQKNEPVEKLLPEFESFVNYDGKTKVVLQQGLGAILLERKILTEVKLGFIDSKPVYNDTHFFSQLVQKKIRSRVLTNCLAFHDNDDWFANVENIKM